MALYGNQGMGQFGSPNFGARDFPLGIRQQYPGTENLMQSSNMYTNLLSGPLSGAYNITAAQADDPYAAGFQAATGAGGQGAFAAPGAATQEAAGLFGGQAKGYVAGQAAKQKQQTDASQGLLDVFNKYAQDIYGTQSAANKLEEAKLQQQEQQQGAIIDLGSLLATVVSGNPIFMEGAGVLTQQGGQPQTAQAFAGLGGTATNAPGYTGGPFSGGLYGRYFGSPAAGAAPTGPYGGAVDPSAVDLTASGLGYS